MVNSMFYTVLSIGTTHIVYSHSVYKLEGLNANLQDLTMTASRVCVCSVCVCVSCVCVKCVCLCVCVCVCLRVGAVCDRQGGQGDVVYPIGYSEKPVPDNSIQETDKNLVEKVSSLCSPFTLTVLHTAMVCKSSPDERRERTCKPRPPPPST